jgi:hypothetical protein
MTPRTLLVAALRETVNPVLKSWGFANPPKDTPERLPTTRLQAWRRVREGFRDEIYFSWAQRDPKFWIEVKTDQAGRMAGAVHRGLVVHRLSFDLVSMRPLWGLIDIPITSFGDRLYRPDSVSLALRRLRNFNHYLVSGDVLERSPQRLWDRFRSLAPGR